MFKTGLRWLSELMQHLFDKNLWRSLTSYSHFGQLVAFWKTPQHGMQSLFPSTTGLWFQVIGTYNSFISDPWVDFCLLLTKFPWFKFFVHSKLPPIEIWAKTAEEAGSSHLTSGWATFNTSQTAEGENDVIHIPWFPAKGRREEKPGVMWRVRLHFTGTRLLSYTAAQKGSW